jgi:hypothetical protein
LFRRNVAVLAVLKVAVVIHPASMWGWRRHAVSKVAEFGAAAVVIIIAGVVVASAYGRQPFHAPDAATAAAAATSFCAVPFARAPSGAFVLHCVGARGERGPLPRQLGQARLLVNLVCLPGRLADERRLRPLLGHILRDVIVGIRHRREAGGFTAKCRRTSTA